MTEKHLGKISSVKFGHVGYQDVMFGIEFQFSFNNSGVGTSVAFWDPNIIKCDSHCKWTEAERSAKFSEIMCYISDLLHQAKVDDLYKLKGIPVEVIIENGAFKSFRILTEVL